MRGRVQGSEGARAEGCVENQVVPAFRKRIEALRFDAQVQRLWDSSVGFVPFSYIHDVLLLQRLLNSCGFLSTAVRRFVDVWHSNAACGANGMHLLCLEEGPEGQALTLFCL